MKIKLAYNTETDQLVEKFKYNNTIFIRSEAQQLSYDTKNIVEIGDIYSDAIILNREGLLLKVTEYGTTRIIRGNVTVLSEGTSFTVSAFSHWFRTSIVVGVIPELTLQGTQYRIYTMNSEYLLLVEEG